MRIVIYGVGKAGLKIAETLSEEKQEVTVIDSNEKRIGELQKRLDILCVAGHIGDDEVVKNSNMNGADIFIAVSDSDEENIIACLIAKRQKITRTIARIRNPSYLDMDILDTEEVGIDHVIQPEKEVANEIVRLIRNPWASEVNPFLNNQVLVVEIKVNQDNIEYLNEKLKIIYKDNLIVIVESDDAEKKIRFFEVRKKIKPDDHIFILEKRSDRMHINKMFEDVYTKIQNIIIVGGGVTGEELLKLLRNAKLKLKLIEKSRKRCRKLSGEFKKRLILCGDGTDPDMLESENISKTDCFVAITGDDEDNIMTSLFAKQKGVKKSIAKVSKSYEEEIVANAGLDATVNINKITINKILRFIRRKELVALSILDEDVEIMEFSARPRSKIIKKALKGPQFIKGAIIGAIYHEGEIFFPKKNFRVKENDLVLVFVNKKVMSTVEKYFKSKK